MSSERRNAIAAEQKAASTVEEAVRHSGQLDKDHESYDTPSNEFKDTPIGEVKDKLVKTLHGVDTPADIDFDRRGLDTGPVDTTDTVSVDTEPEANNPWSLKKRIAVGTAALLTLAGIGTAVAVTSASNKVEAQGPDTSTVQPGEANGTEIEEGATGTTVEVPANETEVEAQPEVVRNSLTDAELNEILANVPDVFTDNQYLQAVAVMDDVRARVIYETSFQEPRDTSAQLIREYIQTWLEQQETAQ